MNKTFVIVLFVLSCSLFGQTKQFTGTEYSDAWFMNLEYTHSLSLPDWGPYTKNYIGISHIPDMKSGLRFDLSVFPGFYRQKVNVPNVLFPSGYHPWRASPDLKFTEFRHELEWKDEVYSDISFSALSDNEYAIRAHFVNNTELPQNLVLHYMASIHYPDILPAFYKGIDKMLWVDALNYKQLSFRTPRPRDDLPYDGFINGEIRQDGLVNGSGLGDNFGGEQGDAVAFDLQLNSAYNDLILALRYSTDGDRPVLLRLSGVKESDITLSGTQGKLKVQVVAIGKKQVGRYPLRIETISNVNFILDGFALLEKGDIDSLEFKDSEKRPVPKIISGPLSNTVLLKYENVEQYYGIAWDTKEFQLREWFTSELDVFFKANLKNHVDDTFYGNQEGHFFDVYQRPISIAPRVSKTLFGTVVSGSRDFVENKLNKFNVLRASNTYETQQKSAVTFDTSALNSENRYGFSQDLMAATLLTNVVYPVYTQKEYIKHYPPGRIWNSLYTWDSGFIGLGLAELDTKRAIENLNAYTNSLDEQAAFIHHGSPVPVQFYLFQELWNRTQSRQLLEYFYPKLKRYHQFLAGDYGSSSTNAMGSNLLKTWDYFYNSGGWDDYPAQVHVHLDRLEATVSPVINTAQAIRTAKILKQVAKELNFKKDVEQYDKQIEKFSKALQKFSWDSDSGYFGYVVHDSSGKPQSILRTAAGENFNKGLDGAYPLIAGIVDEKQREIITNNIFNESKMWTPIGISMVDQSAPYFKKDGYWNGSVWFPHQWFVWKTMLDLGETELAWQIAETALEVWKKESEASYNTFEHFLIETGRGAGWHQFGALSSPVLSWYGAYFQSGRLTVGFDGWVRSQENNADSSSVSAEIVFTKNEASKAATVITVMNPSFEYTVTWNAKEIQYSETSDGVLNINIPLDTTLHGKLRINKK